MDNNVTPVDSQSNARKVASPEVSVASGDGRDEGKKAIVVYIHFPWCLVKCPYCDFVAFRRPRERIDHRAYADAVLAELETRTSGTFEPARRRLGSVFFGGGTPGLWEARDLGRVLSGVQKAFEPRKEHDEQTASPKRDEAEQELEVSVECDPAAFDEDTARALLDAGVTRITLGVQSFDDGRLRFLGRAHNVEQARRAIAAAVRAQVPHVVVDLLHGVPDLSPEMAAAEAAEAVHLGATHVSAYGLTIEANTVFGKRAARGRLPLVEDGVVAESFYAIDETLAALGLEHYEISNYALPGHRSAHNLAYWQGREYLGLGTGAVGMFGPVCANQLSNDAPLAPHPYAVNQVHADRAPLRYRNQPHPERYLAAVRALCERRAFATPSDDPSSAPPSGARSPAPNGETVPLEVECERLDPETRLRERIMLGLRLATGLNLAEAGEQCGAEPFTKARLDALRGLEAQGRILRHGDSIRIPKQAWVWTDAIVAALF